MMIINLSCDFDIISGVSFDEEKFIKATNLMVEHILNSDILMNSTLCDCTFSTPVSIDFLLTDNTKIHKINKEFRGKDKPTDVITFALLADTPAPFRVIPPDEVPLGEIIISLEKIKEQALENDKTFEEELFFILAHGILHLFGYDHLTDSELDKMLKIQEELMEIINV